MRSAAPDRAFSPRRAPSVSYIVVVPEDHIVSAERLAQRLPRAADRAVKIIVACAGQPADLGMLQRTVANAEFLLAPVGTTAEELRELAMRRAPGDIVTLVDGASPRAMSDRSSALRV